jgi:phosphoenolpyruvate-protein kinase (PTS system EI component)
VVLAGDNRAVAERAANVGDDARGQGEEGRPGGRGDAGDQDVAVTHLGELLRAVDDARRAGDLAGGVVTDIGGPLSHGSIVAREYHIPAVLGTGTATERLHSGEPITVDGDAGTVTLAG